MSNKSPIRYIPIGRVENILIDLDNTLVGWTSAMDHRLGRFGLSVNRLDRIPDWMSTRIFKSVYRWTPAFWESIPPLTVSLVVTEAVRKILAQENPPKIFICTRLSGLCNEDIERHGKRVSIHNLFTEAGLSPPEIIFVPAGESKSSHYPLGLCVVIDDYLNNVLDAVSHGHGGILFNRHSPRGCKLVMEELVGRCSM